MEESVNIPLFSFGYGDLCAYTRHMLQILPCNYPPDVEVFARIGA